MVKTMSNFKNLCALVFFTSVTCFAEQNYSSHQDTSSSTSTSGFDYAQTKMITPNASPVVKGGSDVFFDADFIYWTARQSGMSFAATNFIPGSSSPLATDNETYPTGKNLFVNNKYSPGFKAGLGIICDHDGWDVYLQYTWFRTSPSSSAYTASFLGENPELANTLQFYNNGSNNPFIPAESDSATGSSNWKFRFNDFNLELGRNFFVSHYLTLRPHVGLKGGWQRQLWNATWLFTGSQDPLYEEADYLIKQKQKQWNVGLRTGIDTSWMFSKNWSIFGDFALSGVWTQFTNTRIDTATTTGGTTSISNYQTYNQKSQYHVITPVLELALGFRFDWWFNDDDYRFRLQAGWENQVWFSQNNFESVYSTNRTNATRANQLTMQGLTAEARIDF